MFGEKYHACIGVACGRCVKVSIKALRNVINGGSRRRYLAQAYIAISIDEHGEMRLAAHGKETVCAHVADAAPIDLRRRSAMRPGARLRHRLRRL